MSRYKVRKKTYYDILENIRGIKGWMFFDHDITEVEILEPTIENLSLMREYNFIFVVKGFLYPGEFSYLNHIRYRYGLAKIMFLSRSVSTDIMVQAIESLAGQGHLPTKKEIDEDKERNRLLREISIRKRLGVILFF